MKKQQPCDQKKLTCSRESVALHVEGQVIGSRKGSLAELTLERLLSRVLAIVSCQFVGSRELPGTADPCAGVRLLARVSPLVRLQVGGLRVHLFTAVEVALVDLSSLQALTVLTVSRSGGRRGAGRRRWWSQQLTLPVAQAVVAGAAVASVAAVVAADAGVAVAVAAGGGGGRGMMMMRMMVQWVMRGEVREAGVRRQESSRDELSDSRGCRCCCSSW